MSANDAIYAKPEPAEMILYEPAPMSSPVPAPSRYDRPRQLDRGEVPAYVVHIQAAHYTAWLALGIVLATCLIVTMVLLFAHVIWPVLR